MSTAIIEPPKTEPAKEAALPPIGDAPTPQQKEAFLNLFRGKTKAPTEAVTKDTTVVEVTKTPDPAVKETPKAEVKADVKTEPVVEPKTDTERNFAALRQKAEAAEKAAKEAAEERDRFKTEMEELRKKPAPEEFLKEFEKTKAEKAEYQKRLREADLARDPEFNARYDTGIRTAMQQMVDIVAQTGVDRKEATAAVGAWNKGQFAEWMDSMGAVEKMEFGAAMQQAVMLDGQKHAELAQAEQTWQSLQQQREAQAKSQREQYLGSLRGDIDSILKEAADTPLGKEHTEVLAEAKALLMRAGGLEGERLPNKDLLGMVGKSLLLAKGFERQEAALKKSAEEIAELKKTLEERDAFIKSQNGAVPGIGGSLPPAKGDAKTAARAILNPVIN